MIRRAAAAVAAVGGALLLAACGGETGSPSATSSSTTTTTPTTSASSTTAPPTTAQRALRFDLGIVDRIDRREDGRTVDVFDRVQLFEETKRSAEDFTAEPIVAGNTDAPFLNENARLRTYVVDPRVEVLRLANLRRTCADLEDRDEPVWEPVPLERAIADRIWEDHRQVSLTFDAEGDGDVTRIRFSSSC